MNNDVAFKTLTFKAMTDKLTYYSTIGFTHFYFSPEKTGLGQI